MRRDVSGLFIAALLIGSAAFAQGGATGNWSGMYTFSVQVSGCQNKTYTSSGNISLTLLQTGTSLSGRVDLTNFLLFSSNCNPPSVELTRAIIGTISGSTIAWAVPNDSDVTQFSGSMTGNSITVQITDAGGGVGSVTLTRTAADPLALDLTGPWSGTYSFTDRCSNGATQSYSGPFTLGLSQSGAKAGGVVTMQNVPLYDQNCRKITSLNMAMAAAGTVSGSTFVGGVFDPSGSFEFPISAAIGNDSMNGTVSGASETATTGTFSLTRAGTNPPATDFSGSYDGSYLEVDNLSSICFNIGSLPFDGSASVTIVQAGSAIS